MSHPTQTSLTPQQQDALDARTFRRLLKHLDDNKDVQNIDLMITGNFCRNCLSKWYKAEAEGAGHDMDMDAARQRVYGMPYSEWKAHHQPEATAAQLEAFAKRSGSA